MANGLNINGYTWVQRNLQHASSLVFSTTYDANTLASKCNNGVYSPSSHENSCCSGAGDQNAWLLINAGTQSFSKVIAYTRQDGWGWRIDGATLTMLNGGNVTTPAVTFSSFGSGLATYTFCSTWLTRSTCINSCLSNSYYNFRTGACAACGRASVYLDTLHRDDPEAVWSVQLVLGREFTKILYLRIYNV